MSTSQRLSALAWGTLLLAFATGPATHAQSSQTQNAVIINTPKPYGKLASDIQKLGGRVKLQYEYIDAIAADVPVAAMPAVISLVGENAISKDSLVAVPKGVENTRNVVPLFSDSDIYTSVPVGSATRIFPVASSSNVPSEKAYALNFADLKVRDLHMRGYTGKDIVVAVLDTGVRAGYASLDSDGSIVGGEDLVGDGFAYNSPMNDPHGTFVAGLISGNARFSVPTGTFASSMDLNFPGALETMTTGRALPLIGTAPEAGIYMVRVIGKRTSTGSFPPTPKSRIMAAIERVIKLRENFDRFGQYSASNPRGGFNIRVCNMSLGTSTVYAGHEPLEQLVDKLLDKDILPVIAAGDAGPSSLTISSPATSLSALAVGATNPALNERLINDVLFDFVGVGSFVRPTDHLQTAYFSSRGPTADGRILPDIMAAGFDVVSQGCGGLDATGNCKNDPKNLDIASGTSFSAPVVSGIAAALRQAFPRASATQIAKAITSTGDRSQIGDRSTVLDQGHGVVNATAAANFIQSGKKSNDRDDDSDDDDDRNKNSRADSSVKNNIEQNTSLKVDHGTVRQNFRDLKPGQRAEILYEVEDKTAEVDIDFTVKLGTNQNQIYGDDLYVFIHTAKTSSGGVADYFERDLFIRDQPAVTTIPIVDPEPGIMRITMLGDFTNASNVSVDVRVTSRKEPLPKTTVDGTIRQGDSLVFPIDIPTGVSEAVFQLKWQGDWAHYPTNDLDMYLFDPNGGAILGLGGATLRDPEQIAIQKPKAGKWLVNIQGFAVPTKKDNFDLSITLDGKPVVLKPSQR
jgi:subtilisin family serine protease